MVFINTLQTLVETKIKLCEKLFSIQKGYLTLKAYWVIRAVARFFFVSDRAWTLRESPLQKIEHSTWQSKIKKKIVLHFLSSLSGKINNTNPKSAPLLFCVLGRGPGGPVLAMALSMALIFL